MDPLSPEAIGQFYDQTSQLFEFMSSANIHYGYWPEGKEDLPLVEAQEQLSEMMITRMQARAGQHLLDVGCGLGRPALRIARETGCKVTGITVSQKQVTEANRRAAAAGLDERVRFQFANAMEMPFAEAAVDAAWAIESLLHMPDRRQVLREMRRVVAPGGRIGIADMISRAPMSGDDLAFIRATFLLQSALPLQDYQRLVLESGLELVEVLDISANTMQTLPSLIESFEQKSADLRQMMGETAFTQTQSGWAKASELYQKYLGYTIIIARRPEGP